MGKLVLDIDINESKKINFCKFLLPLFGMKATINKPVVGERMVYFMVWALVILVPILNSKMMSEEHVSLIDILTAWSKIFPYLVIFIISNSILVPHLLLKGRVITFFALALVMLAAIFYPLEYYKDSIRHLPYAGTNITDITEMYVIQGRASFTDLAWYWNILLGLFMIGANAGIKAMFLSIQNEQKMIALERQSLKAEMDYLKYQINPHFFMNTLNNIHALIDIDPTSAQETVIELSKMMRYVLYDSEHTEIDVRRDLEFIDNYIKLMRIRYTDDVDVRVNVQQNIPTNAKVPPLVFIVLVENAFKHGVSYNKPSFVYIDIMFDKGTITARVENSRYDVKVADKGASGMGLENIRKRLTLLFGDEYKLKIDESRSESYCVELTIPLKYD